MYDSIPCVRSRGHPNTIMNVYVYKALLRDWSLITGRGGGGGLQNGRGGGACEVLPLRKGGGGQQQF